MGILQVKAGQKVIMDTQNPLLNLPLMLLPARTILFGMVQVLFIYLLGFTWKESIAWWPFFAIITNIIMFLLLSALVRREGKSYLDLINIEKKQFKQDLKRVLWVLPIGGGLGFAGMSAVSYFMYGSPTLPDNMILPLPLWAGIIALIFFPITNALVEIPTYMGYCFPRLEIIWKSKLLAVAFSAFFLAFQHLTLPILFDDVKYMIWHAICFIPLSIVVGFIYIKIRRLVPIMIVHWIMDVSVVLGVFILSIS
ncbi:type II CAAX prenyl endopeptidase Rce1 family protein [Neobacillus sp. NPDC097160]|uniref:CPBP family glutamic-type intramembrane protease n=1 Tax=Neobacillus sp. NPDC097160 TaxID=3364298 RepID=UPI0037F98CEE